MVQDKYSIKNKYLEAMISNATGFDNRLGYRGMRHGKGVGSALLTFFVKKAFNIHRLPFHEDRHFRPSDLTNEMNVSTILSIFSKITKNEINEIVNEIKVIYEFTQKKLSNESTIILSRKVHNDNISNYADLLYKLKKCAEILEQDNIEIEMDILNSFGDDNAYSQHPVDLCLEIPKENILYCHKFIAGGDTIVERGEWVVINNSSNGLVKIPISSIKIKEGFFCNSIIQDKESAEDFLHRMTPFSLHLYRYEWDKKYHVNILKPKLITRFKIALDSFRNGEYRGQG